MKRVWKHVSALLALLLCMAAIHTNAHAVAFPEIKLVYDAASRSVIVSRVPMYDDTGAIRYALEVSLSFSGKQLESFRYVPEEKNYDMPERQGYRFNWDDRQSLMPASGVYSFQARLVAQDRQNPGTVIETGPLNEFGFEYIKVGEEPKETPEVPTEPPEEPKETPPPSPPPKEEPPQPEGEFNPIVDLCLDANGGTFRNNRDMNLYDASMAATPGTTLAETGYTIDKITAVGKTFQGWIAYNAVDNTAISGLLTTEEVLNYTIPNHHIRFEIQWKTLDSEPITAITYAALYNGTGQPSPNVRVTLIANGNRYSGNGYVTISKDVYSKWKGNVKVIWECPGEYISANNRWIPDYFESEGTVKSFIKEGSCYTSVSKTGKGADTPSPRDVVNDFFYSVRNAKPDVSPVEKEPAPAAPEPPAVTPPATPSEPPAVTAALPEGHTLSAQRHESGSTYDDAAATLKAAADTANILLFDIEAKDASGAAVHQLNDTAEVKIQLPKEYVIQPENTVVVYYIPGDGTAEACDTTYYGDDPANRYLIFKTNHFSLYAVAEVAKPAEAPAQPDPPVQPETPAQPETPPQPEPPAQQEAPTPSLPVVGIALAAAAVILVAAVVLLKKRRG